MTALAGDPRPARRRALVIAAAVIALAAARTPERTRPLWTPPAPSLAPFALHLDLGRFARLSVEVALPRPS